MGNKRDKKRVGIGHDGGSARARKVRSHIERSDLRYKQDARQKQPQVFVSLRLNWYPVSRSPTRNKDKSNRKSEPRRCKWGKFLKPNLEGYRVATPKHR